MKQLNKDWLSHVINSHDKFKRTTGKNDVRCTQEILIDRYFKFLENKAFKLKIDDEVHYGLFVKYKQTHHLTNGKKQITYNYGVSKSLSHNSYEFKIQFINEKCETVKFILDWNEIRNIEYEEITVKKYYEIVELFI